MVTIDVQTLQAGLRRLLAPGQPLPMEFAFTYIKAFYLGAKHPSPNPNPSPNLHPNRNPNVHQGLLPRRRRYPRVVARAPRVQRAPDLRPRRADGRQHAGQEEAAHRPRDAIELRNCGTAGVCGVRGGRLRMTCTHAPVTGTGRRNRIIISKGARLTHVSFFRFSISSVFAPSRWKFVGSLYNKPLSPPKLRSPLPHRAHILSHFRK